MTKDEGDLLQDFIWQTRGISGGDAKLPGAPTDKETAKQHAKQALEGLRTLGTLIISNGQFRKLLNDATILLRDMVGDVASKIGPTEEQLAQLDRPAEDNTWHDVPNLSASNIKAQIKAQYSKNKPFGKGDVQDAVQTAVTGATQAQTAEGAQEAVQAGVDQLQAQTSANIPDETKDRAQEALDSAQTAKDTAVQRSKAYLQKKMPQERRDQTLWRLRKMIAEIQGHSDCMSTDTFCLFIGNDTSSRSRSSRHSSVLG